MWLADRFRRRVIAPTGVRLELTDGTMIGPLPLRYEGRCERHGVHQWIAMAEDSLADRMTRVTSDPWPPNTEVYLLFLPNAMLATALAAA